MSHAEAMEKLEKERDIYERQTDKLHELNINVRELIMDLSTSFNSIRAIRNILDILNSVGLLDDAKKKVSAQIAEIVKKQVESIKRKGDKQKERVNCSDRVSAPLSVVTIIGVAFSILLVFFGGLIAVNGNLVQSEWLNDYLVNIQTFVYLLRWHSFWVARLLFWC